MDNNYLTVFIKFKNQYLLPLLNGLEEQGIKYEVIEIKNIELNLDKLSFNIAIVLDENRVELKSKDFLDKVKLEVYLNNKKVAKEFGCDVGRYIKKIPLKGDWYE